MSYRSGHFSRRLVMTLRLVALVALPMAGCNESRPTNEGPLMPPRPVSAALTWLYHLPGMDGPSPTDAAFMRGLQIGGVADQAQLFDWLGRYRDVFAVMAYEHNRAAARQLAGILIARARQHPEQRLVVTAWSAGCAVTIWALEDLPKDVSVQSVLLIEPAVNPAHDLSRALRHVKGHLFVHQSIGDWFDLGLGTIVFGTADGGAHCPAAGFVGFTRPPGASLDVYHKLIPIPWRDTFIHQNDFGDHNSAMSQDLARETLAPILIDDLNGAATTEK